MSDITPSACAAEHVLDEFRRVGIVEILHREFDAVDRLHVEKIDRDDFALPLFRLHMRGGDL